MVNFTPEQIRELMDKPEHIRNITIIAHTKHGKTIITENLATKAAISLSTKTVCERYSDLCGDEPRRDTIVKSTNISLYYEHNTSKIIENDTYLFHLIDSPGNNDFQSDATSALRVADGTLLVVDCIEGACTQTEAVLRAAMIEKIRPVLMMNKIDRLILELQVDAEEMYRSFDSIIESVNINISNHGQPDMGDILLYPNKGNVAFGSGKDCWAFTLTTFARIYSKKFLIDIDKIQERLWGDNYYDPKSKKWVKEPTNNESGNLRRAFCAFVMEPIIKLSRSIMDGNVEQMNKILASIEISLSPEEQELKGNRLLRLVMSKWMSISDTLLEMMVLHLPSPKVAQKYRVSYLYEGPQDDEVAASIRDCNPKGPLIMYVSKMVPTSELGRFFAFGRVFGGTISSGQKVRIMGPNYKPGKNDDLFVKSIHRTLLMMGRYAEYVSDVPCGNVVGLVGIDQYLVKTGTISDNESAHCIKSMKYSLAPVVRVAVEPKNLADLPRLIEGLRKLAKSDPFVRASFEEEGQNILAGCSELHIEKCLNDLQTVHSNCEIKSSDPFVIYKETVTSTSSQICFAKTPNKHNKLYVTAEPLNAELADLIDSGKLGPNDDFKERGKILCDDFEWEKADAQKIWSFGPHNQGSNILVNLVDVTRVYELYEVKDVLDYGFQWATKEGVLAGENMRSVRMNLVDVAMHSDAIHRGTGQITPTARRVFYAAELTAEPRMQEPVFLVEITVPDDVKSEVYKCLSERRGTIIEEGSISSTPLIKIKAYLPVAESFGKFST